MSGFDMDRWQAVSVQLDRALDMNETERAAWLATLRVESPLIAAELDSLLDEHRLVQSQAFLERSVDVRPDDESSLAGQAIGSYTLVSPIGHGGMGSVWLARRSDGRFEGHAAIKFLSAAMVDRRGEDRFRREGSILARLAHPNIARLNDAGLSPLGQPYLVLEYVDGMRIDRYCDDRSLDVDARLRLFLDVLAAVAHAHANLIVHRDIKPSNVLVTPDGEVKLLDFGIAKLVEGAAGATAVAATHDSMWALTPEYAAPEQVTGGAVTTATDVYSLGVVLYVLLAGRHPFESAKQSPAELLKAITDSEAPPLSAGASGSALRRTLRGDLETIVAKALKKNPQERYTSVALFADDVRRYLAREPIGARPDSFVYRARQFGRRHRAAVAATALVCLALASLVTFYTVRLAAERNQARQEAEKAAKVTQLLTDLLTNADPFSNRPGKEPTVREVLDASVERVRKDLADQPELQAEVFTVIGRVYQRLGAADKARPLLEGALTLARNTTDGEDVRVAQALNDLGVLLAGSGDFAAAEPLLQQSLDMRRRLLGDMDKDVAVTLVELARSYSDRGQDGQAEPLIREALAIRRNVFGEEHRATATSLSELGLLLWRRGDIAGAEPVLRQTLDVSRKVHPPDHPDVSAALNNLALVSGERGDFVTSERLLRESLDIKRKALGPTHAQVAQTLNNLSFPLQQQGKLDEAAAALEQAVQIARPAQGDAHPLVAGYLSNLAGVYLKRGQAGEAEPLLRQSLATRERTYPAGDWRTAVTRSYLGWSLTAQKRYAEAEPLLLAAVKALKDGPGRQGREAKATRARLVTLYESWGRPEKAAPYR